MIETERLVIRLAKVDDVPEIIRFYSENRVHLQPFSPAYKPDFLDPSMWLDQVRHRAHELERSGYEIVSLNIGNPKAFGFRTPETMRLAMIENLAEAEGYCHQKGIFPAREAVVMQQQERGITGITAEEVFIGNGVSELIDLVLRALLNDGDEVLVARVGPATEFENRASRRKSSLSGMWWRPSWRPACWPESTRSRASLTRRAAGSR